MRKLIIVLTVMFAATFVDTTLFCHGNMNPEYSQTIPSEQMKLKKKCPRCNGKGHITIKKRHAACAGKGCSGCDYKGYSETYLTCSKCNGSGYIVQNL